MCLFGEGKQSKRDSKRDLGWTRGSFLLGKSEEAVVWVGEQTCRLCVQSSCVKKAAGSTHELWARG